MAAPEFDVLLKTLLVGESGAGKTSFLERYSDNFFGERYISCIGIDFKIKTVQCLGKRVKLQMWDTAGQERFRTITRSYYRGSAIIFIAFDVTEADALSKLDHWITEVESWAPETCTPVVLGCKIDLESKRKVTAEDAEAFAGLRSLPYFECSSKTSIGVDDAVMGAMFQHFSGQPNRNRRRSYPDKKAVKGVQLPAAVSSVENTTPKSCYC